MDPIKLSLFSNRLKAVCDEMAAVLRRSAFSPNIKDRLDFSCAVFDAAGRIDGTESALRLVESLGLDAEAVADEAQSSEVAAQILHNQRLASTLGIRGTPTFVGCDQIHDGLLNPEELVEILDTEEDDS